MVLSPRLHWLLPLRNSWTGRSFVNKGIEANPTFGSIVGLTKLNMQSTYENCFIVGATVYLHEKSRLYQI